MMNWCSFIITMLGLFETLKRVAHCVSLTMLWTKHQNTNLRSFYIILEAGDLFLILFLQAFLCFHLPFSCKETFESKLVTLHWLVVHKVTWSTPFMIFSVTYCSELRSATTFLIIYVTLDQSHYLYIMGQGSSSSSVKWPWDVQSV